MERSSESADGPKRGAKKGTVFVGYIPNYSPRLAYQCHAAIGGQIKRDPLPRDRVRPDKARRSVRAPATSS
ncbi:MAG: hypothetical protein H0W66_03970 [Chthoniobacterales bacterium]|nr:hypothetical protein [Chthoniobacterales bacterium]